MDPDHAIALRRHVDESAADVAASARADEQLATHLTAAARDHPGYNQRHNSGMDAAAVPDQSGALSGTGAGELAAPKKGCSSCSPSTPARPSPQPSRSALDYRS
jgi:hypothetical protein